MGNVTLNWWLLAISTSLVNTHLRQRTVRDLRLRLMTLLLGHEWWLLGHWRDRHLLVRVLGWRLVQDLFVLSDEFVH